VPHHQHQRTKVAILGTNTAVNSALSLILPTLSSALGETFSGD
jgi:hypothetical protein